MADIEKLKRSQFQTFINTTPGTSETWKLLGTGIEEYGIDYNPEVNTIKWIINDASTSTIESLQKQGSVSQTCYKGDAVFEYVYSLLDKTGAECETQVLDIDTWNKVEGENSYSAKKSNIAIGVTRYSGDTIEYDIYYNGDPIVGSATISDGTPTFVEKA